MNKNILVTRSSVPPFEEYIEKIKTIWESGWMTNNGPLYIELEEALKNYFDCENLQLYVNGHMALDIALKALELKGEVITTPFTFVSTTHSIVMNGLTPVFCDIKYSDYTIDESKLEALITEKTCAILPVHVYGQPCNLETLDKIAKKYNLKLIYDAAHAFGVKVNGKSIANYGDISMFSFHATKVFNTIEGGALVFADKGLERNLKNLRNFGIEGPESVVSVGLNAKMNEFQAAMGICNLHHIDENVQIRKHVAEMYESYLADCNGVKTLNINSDANVLHNYSYFPVVINEKITGYTRDDLFDALKKHNIFTRKYFYPLTSDLECYRDRFKQYELPISRYVAGRVLALPMYAGLEDENISVICDIIRNLKSKLI